MFGLFIGPASWYFSESMQTEYADFVAEANETTGVVYKKFSKFRGKSTSFFVAIRYNTNGQFNTLASKVPVETKMHSNLEVGDEIVVYYKNGYSDVNDIKIKGEQRSENIGPVYRPGVGKILTFISYSTLFFFVFFKKRIAKLSEWFKKERWR